MTANIPAWASDVIDDYGDAKAGHWNTRWSELSSFIREINSLPTAAKKIIFERAVYVGCYIAKEKPRESIKELERINDQLIDCIGDAIALLKQREQIKLDHSVRDGIVDLFDSLKSAIDEHPTWAHVAKKEVNSFLAMRSQSRSGPDMADLLKSFVSLSDTASFSEHGEVIGASQKNEADPIRHMLSQVGNLNKEFLHHVGINEKFRLSDSSIADLVNVAFDFPADKQVDQNTVKRRRQDAKNKGYDYWGQ